MAPLRFPNDIVLFDGDCNFCTGWVLWVIRKDRNDRFRFSATQTERGHEVLKGIGEKTDTTDSVILIRNKNVYKRSGAALRIVSGLGGLYYLASVFLIVPRFIRDWVYDFIANRRYKWWGRREQCYVPDEELKKKFI